MSIAKHYDVVIIGAGSVGIASGCFVKQLMPALAVAVIDRGAPMNLTSAVSGENYRNWWPHPVMKAFMDRSIGLLEDFDQKTDRKVINTRNGYVLVSRDQHPCALLTNLGETFGDGGIRDHFRVESYRAALKSELDGVDVLYGADTIHQAYPSFDNSAQTLVHIRRGGCISTHVLGSYMLSVLRQQGFDSVQANVENVETGHPYKLHLSVAGKIESITADAIVNAAGPHAGTLSAMLGVELPIENVLQQKIAFADTAGAIDRQLPFTIDLDHQQINWSAQERSDISQDSTLGFLANSMPGSIHCRPDGAVTGNRIKLGWAYNESAAAVTDPPVLDDHFPEVVLRGASRLHPGLMVYADGFPRDFVHYGGYYTLTKENWPLIGDTVLPGYFIATAMSGFGSMAACAAGELVARYVTGADLPAYAQALSMHRYDNDVLMEEIQALQSRGIL